VDLPLKSTAEAREALRWDKLEIIDFIFDRRSLFVQVLDIPCGRADPPRALVVPNTSIRDNVLEFILMRTFHPPMSLWRSTPATAIVHHVFATQDITLIPQAHVLG